MKLDKGKISNSQLMFLIGNFIQGSIFITSIMPAASYRDKWLIIPISSLIFIPIAFIYIKLTEKFPNDNLMQINDKTFGTILGRTFSALYFIFFLLLFIINFRVPNVIMTNNYMSETPPIVIAIFMIPFILWAVNGGIEIIARVSFITLLISSVSIIFIFFLLFGKIELKHLFPVFNLPLKTLIQAANVVIADILGELLVFLMCIPQIINKKGTKKAYLLGLAVGCLTLMLTEFITICVLGNVAIVNTAPFSVATRQIEILSITVRIEFVIMSVLIFTNFVKISVIFYALALCAGQLFNLRSYKILMIPLCLVSFGLFNSMYSTVISQFESRSNTWAILALIFEIIIPLATLITAAIRKLPNTTKAEG